METAFLDVELKPNPPMRPVALVIVLAVVSVVDLAFVLGFVLRGAWPILPFLGLDIALLAWGFRASTIAARRREWIKLTASLLSISRKPPRGTAQEIRLNPYWVSVQIDDPPEPWSRLTLQSHGRSVGIADFLAAPERLSFAKTLRAALWRARQAPAPICHSPPKPNTSAIA